MPSALVLLTCKSGYERFVIETIRKVPEVVETNFVMGGYDIIAKVTADRTEKLKEVVGTTIRDLRGVKSSLTLLSVEPKRPA